MEIELQAVISSLQLALYIGFSLIVSKAGVSKNVLNALQNWDWNCSQLMAVFVEGSSLLSQFDECDFSVVRHAMMQSYEYEYGYDTDTGIMIQQFFF